MLIAPYADDVVVWAPAKVNLYLEVLAKRADGYHELETLMVGVSLYDTLVFKEDSSGAISLRCNRLASSFPRPLGQGRVETELSTGPDNLVRRAAVLLQQHTGCTRGARIRLAKRIPLAAGLAGGSTDAAATLAGLNRLWRLGLPDAELAALAARLGSDVPFFFATPAAWCTGRGEVVAPAALGKRLWFVLLCPPFGLSTVDVYRGLTVPREPTSSEGMRRAVSAGDADEIGRRLHNRLEGPARRLRPGLDDYLRLLAAHGPAGQAMSGSGSTLFAVCRGHREAARIAHELRVSPGLAAGGGVPEKGKPTVYLVRSCA